MTNLSESFVKALKRDKYLYILLIPGFTFFAIFCYVPMYGALIAFKNFLPGRSVWGSEWVGFKWFIQFFQGPYFFRLLKNTVMISLYTILWGFPIPILFALLLNEAKDGFFKRFTQTVSYLPHFISIVVAVGMLNNLFDMTGSVTNLISSITGARINFLSSTEWFRTMYVGSGVWQNFGWDSIIFLAAISGIDPQLYEAAKIDGASRLKQTMYITLPGIMPTIIIILILKCGSILSVGFVKILLMYSPATYSVADVISTYTYRVGLIEARYSFASAVGLFNSVANFIVLVIVNRFSRRVSETSLW